MSGSLTQGPADILRWLVIQLAQGTDPTQNPQQAWPVYCGNEPDSPDNVITTYDTAGHVQGRLQITGEQVEYPGCQIRVRATDYVTGWQQINGIKIALDEQVAHTIVDIPNTTNQYDVIAVNRTSGVLAIGKDVAQGNKRHLFTLNVTLSVRQKS